MRVTVSHNKSKAEAIRLVDRSFDDLFKNLGAIPVQFVQERRSWEGSTMSFALSARMGFVSNPMKGTIDVTESDITIDADLGWLERLMPRAKVQGSLTGALRGLLR